MKMRKALVAWMAVVCGVLLSGPAVSAEEQGGPAPSVADSSSSSMPLPGSRAGGNRQPTAEEVRQMMQGVMGPMMGEMMSSMLKSMSKTLAEPQIAQNLATFTRNYYQALIDRGFTEEQALKIVTSTGLPNLGGKT